MKIRSAVSILAVVAVAAGLFVPASIAGHKHKYRQVAEFKAGGKAKELQLDRKAGWCMIRILEGVVIIDSVVVVEGKKKTMIPVTNKLVKGDKKTIDLGPSRHITGLIINDREDGKYRVYLKQ